MASASNTEREIISYVLENPDEAVQLSIHELARRSFVSASAVTRLCKKTGFQNYKDYQRSLSCELALKKELLSRQAGEFEIRPEDSLEVLVDNSFQRTISLTIFTFVATWNSFIWPLVVTNERSRYTLPVALSLLATNFEKNHGLVMAGSTITFLVPFILYCFLQKQFVAGIALGGVKE